MECLERLMHEEGDQGTASSEGRQGEKAKRETMFSFPCVCLWCFFDIRAMRGVLR